MQQCKKRIEEERKEKRSDVHRICISRINDREMGCGKDQSCNDACRTIPEVSSDTEENVCCCCAQKYSEQYDSEVGCRQKSKKRVKDKIFTFLEITRTMKYQLLDVITIIFNFRNNIIEIRIYLL